MKNMKKIVFLFAIILVSNISVFCQNENNDIDTIYVKINDIVKRNSEAGEYLVLAQRNMFAAVGLGAASGATFLIPLIKGGNITKETYTSCYVVGGIFALSSLVCYISGIRQIGLAGKELQIKASSNEIKVAINL